MAQLRLPHATPRPEVRYVRAPEPIHFPEEALVPESKTHLEVRTFLYRLLQFALGPEHSVGSEQFVYWLATDTGRSVAPDVFVKLGVPDTKFGSWKTWEQGGAPELAVEIVSPSEREKGAREWDKKFAGYHELGVKELVRFDDEQSEGQRLRVWDRVDGDLVERVVVDDRSPCLTLGLLWTVRMISTPIGEVLGLRLVDDEGRLLETSEERKEADARAAKAREEKAEARAISAVAREEEALARASAAEARVRELEEELRRRR